MPAEVLGAGPATNRRSGSPLRVGERASCRPEAHAGPRHTPGIRRLRRARRQPWRRSPVHEADFDGNRRGHDRACRHILLNSAGTPVVCGSRSTVFAMGKQERASSRRELQFCESVTRLAIADQAGTPTFSSGRVCPPRGIQRIPRPVAPRLRCTNAGKSKQRQQLKACRSTASAWRRRVGGAAPHER